jgi:hypothetical protein
VGSEIHLTGKGSKLIVTFLGDGIPDSDDFHPTDAVPENASRLIANAEREVGKAEEEGRTQGLRAGCDHCDRQSFGLA